MKISRIIWFVIAGVLFILGIGNFISHWVDGWIGLLAVILGLGIFVTMLAKVQDLRPPAAHDDGLDDFIERCIAAISSMMMHKKEHTMQKLIFVITASAEFGAITALGMITTCGQWNNPEFIVIKIIATYVLFIGIYILAWLWTKTEHVSDPRL